MTMSFAINRSQYEFRIKYFKNLLSGAMLVHTQKIIQMSCTGRQFVLRPITSIITNKKIVQSLWCLIYFIIRKLNRVNVTLQFHVDVNGRMTLYYKDDSLCFCGRSHKLMIVRHCFYHKINTGAAFNSTCSCCEFWISQRG